MMNMEQVRHGACVALAVGAGLFALKSCDVAIQDVAGTRDALTCPSPDEGDMNQVHKLLENPSLIQTLPWRLRMYDVGLSGVQAEIANVFDVSLPDNTLLEEMEQSDVSERGYDYYASATGAYLAQFGVTLEVAEADELDEGGEVPTAAQLNEDVTKQKLINIASGFRYLPFEYVEATGLKRILLAANIDYAAYAITEDDSDTVVADVTNRGNPSTMPHEMYHLEDTEVCGGDLEADTDTPYEALNRDEDIYTYDRKSDATNGLVTVTGDSAWELGELRYGPGPGSDEEACRRNQAYTRALRETVAYSEYGLTWPTEDKAELGAQIAFPDSYDEVLDPSRPIIRDKFYILMARLYHIAPNVVRYFAHVSTRPEEGYYDEYIAELCEE